MNEPVWPYPVIPTSEGDTLSFMQKLAILEHNVNAIEKIVTDIQTVVETKSTVSVAASGGVAQSITVDGVTSTIPQVQYDPRVDNIILEIGILRVQIAEKSIVSVTAYGGVAQSITVNGVTSTIPQGGGGGGEDPRVDQLILDVAALDAEVDGKSTVVVTASGGVAQSISVDGVSSNIPQTASLASDVAQLQLDVAALDTEVDSKSTVVVTASGGVAQSISVDGVTSTIPAAGVISGTGTISQDVGGILLSYPLTWELFGRKMIVHVGGSSPLPMVGLTSSITFNNAPAIVNNSAASAQIVSFTFGMSSSGYIFNLVLTLSNDTDAVSGTLTVPNTVYLLPGATGSSTSAASALASLYDTTFTFEFPLA